jgi:hypothetical protein
MGRAIDRPARCPVAEDNETICLIQSLLGSGILVLSNGEAVIGFYHFDRQCQPRLFDFGLGNGLGHPGVPRISSDQSGSR